MLSWPSKGTGNVWTAGKKMPLSSSYGDEMEPKL